MFWPPPVVMLMTASVRSAMPGRNSQNTSGSGVGLPVRGSRAWRWMIDAPASAAPSDASTISAGVMGRWGDIVGVWMEPVTAHVMMTLSRGATMQPSRVPFGSRC